MTRLLFVMFITFILLPSPFKVGAVGILGGEPISNVPFYVRVARRMNPVCGATIIRSGTKLIKPPKAANKIHATKAQGLPEDFAKIATISSVKNKD